MKRQNLNELLEPVTYFFINYSVTIIIAIFLFFAIPLSGFSTNYLITQILARLSRDTLLVLSLIIPVIAGMGMNFSIVLGAMAGEIAILFITDWQIIGIPGLLLAMLISTPIAILLGIFAGKVLDKAKGKEMVAGFILAFFMNGVYQLIVLYGFGRVVPFSNTLLLLPRGYGIRNAINLLGIREVLDKAINFKILGIAIPIATFLFIAFFCLLITWFQKTKLGHEIRTVGQDDEIARNLGIDVSKTRIISVVLSTLLASYGQILFLQNIGTMNTYDSHTQVGIFSVAAILIGGASIKKATIANALIGVVLFHTMFIVSPKAGTELIGDAQLGEYFRVFVSYGVIAFSLVLYAWRLKVEKEIDRRKAIVG